MAEFTPINTQEEFDAAISKRIERERAKYSDYDDLKARVGGYEQKIADMTAAHEKEVAELNAAHESQITGLNSKIADYETNSVKMRVAMEAGLPAELADRLQGTDEESFRADAQKLLTFAPKPTAPVFNPEPNVQTDPKKQGLAKMVSELNTERKT